MADGENPLDRLKQYVLNKNKRDKTKLDELHVRRDVERAHSQYLVNQHSPCDAVDLAHARIQAQSWANKHGQTLPNGMRKQRILSEIEEGMRNPSPRRHYERKGGVLLQVKDKPIITHKYSQKSVSSVSRSPTHYPGDAYNKHTGDAYKCPILMCEAAFSSLRKLETHLRKPEDHSPCHPYKHCLDMTDNWDVKEFRCPVCCSRFHNEHLCIKHMIQTDHKILDLYKPVRISAFACAQCLVVYTTAMSCREHMALSNHTEYAYRLRDDPDVAEPLLMSPSILAQYEDACRDVRSHLECVECEQRLMPEEDIFSHHLDHSHTLMSITERTLVDVFKLFQKKYSCVQCQVLFKDCPSVGLGGVHHCNDVQLGMIVKNDCLGSDEYMLRLTLHRQACSKPEFPEDGAAVFDLDENNSRSNSYPKQKGAKQLKTGAKQLKTGAKQLKTKQELHVEADHLMLNDNPTANMPTGEKFGIKHEVIDLEEDISRSCLNSNSNRKNADQARFKPEFELDKDNTRSNERHSSKRTSLVQIEMKKELDLVEVIPRSYEEPSSNSESVEQVRIKQEVDVNNSRSYFENPTSVRKSDEHLGIKLETEINKESSRFNKSSTSDRFVIKQEIMDLTPSCTVTRDSSQNDDLEQNVSAFSEVKCSEIKKDSDGDMILKQHFNPSLKIPSQKRRLTDKSGNENSGYKKLKHSLSFENDFGKDVNFSDGIESVYAEADGNQKIK